MRTCQAAVTMTVSSSFVCTYRAAVTMMLSGSFLCTCRAAVTHSLSDSHLRTYRNPCISLRPSKPLGVPCSVQGSNTISFGSVMPYRSATSDITCGTERLGGGLGCSWEGWHVGWGTRWHHSAVGRWLASGWESRGTGWRYDAGWASVGRRLGGVWGVVVEVTGWYSVVGRRLEWVGVFGGGCHPQLLLVLM